MALKKNQIVVLGAAVVIALGLTVYAFVAGKQPKLAEGAVVSRMDLDEGITVDGTVTAATDVQLAFQAAGRINSVSADVGQTVSAGQVIATLDTSTEDASLLQAQAALETQQLKLQDLTGELSATGTDVETSLENNRQNLADKLTAGYVATDAALNSYIDNLFYSESINKGEPNFGYTIVENGETVVVSANLSDENRLTAERAQIATLMTTWSSLNQDLSTDAEISASEAAGEQAMTATQNFLTDLSNVFAGLTSQDQNYQTVYSSFKTAIAASRSSVDTALSNLSAAEQTSASATATVSPYDVQLQQAAVTAAQAQVDAVDATIGQSTIKAPFTGVITVQNAKVGEIASPNAPVVEMISNGLLQIDAYVSEADIGKIKIGTTASTTLDAFGTSKILDATVIAIDPGETMTNGTGSYKVTLQFNTADPAVKTGMTANVDFKLAHRTNVIAVPSQAIITKDNNTYVVIDNGNGTTTDQQVTTGIEGDNGYVEITSGLNAGDHIITFTNQ